MVVIVVGVVAAAGAVVAARPLYHAVCPETWYEYYTVPLPSVPLARGGFDGRVGDRFAVGGSSDRPSGAPAVTGPGGVVRWTGTETFPLTRRCRTLETAYRYYVFTAERAGEVTVDGVPVRITA